MTTPNEGGFDYTDDSVIARVSFDIPDQAATNIQQLSGAMAAMRTQVEAVTRAQADWVEYLQQIPDIAEAANQALNRQITLMERMSYIQNEIGGGNLVGGGVGGYGGYGAGAPGGGGYSTAAPMGYAPPWMANAPGTGMGGGNGAGAAEAAAAQYQKIEAENPGLAANMDSMHGGGRAINPATLGWLAAGASGVVGKIKGQVAGRTGGTSAKTSQPGHGERDSAQPADNTKGGAPAGSMDPAEESEPASGSTLQEKASYYLAKGQQLANQMDGGKGGRMAKVADSLGWLSNKANPAAAGGGGGGLLDAAGALWKKLPLGAQITAGLGAGAMAFNKVQDIGEKVTEFQQLGSVQGGDWQTGMKYEAQARIMALNPFITTQQARQAMQMALKEGFRGDNYDTVQDFMIQNFKELGVSMGQSMEIMKAQAIGMSEGDSQEGLKKSLDQTLNTMKELSAEGGASFPERVNQLQELSQAMAGDGYSPDNIQRSALGLQEGYGDSLALRDSITGISARANKDTMFKTMVAGKMGITGMLPGALGPALQRAGLDNDEVLQIGAESVAKMVQGHSDPMNRIANFMSIMNNVYGQELNFEQAEALLAPYDKGVGGGNVENPLTKANRKVARQGNTNTNAGRISSNAADEDWNRDHPAYRPSPNAAGVAGSFDDAGRGTANFAPSGNAPAPLPQAGSPIPVNVNSSGTVSGNLTVTIDQAGRASAPSVITLTGTQKAAYAGYGSSQLNNAPPGDPMHNHAFTSFPQPGGG